MAAVVAKFNKADKAAKQLAAEVDDLTRRVGERRNRFYQWKIRELEERAATVRNTRDRLNEKMTELADIAWQYEHTRWTMRNSVGEDVLPTLRNRLEGVKWAIGSMEGMPAPQNIDEMKRFVAEAEELIKVLEDGGDDVSDIARLLADEKIKLYDLITSNVDLSDMRAISDDTIASIPRLLEEGWTTLGNIGLPNVVVRDEVWKMLQNMKRLNQPAITRELGKFIGGYTRFFKAYATLSPGFHIRNALSNSFMLVAAGADVRLFRKSFSLARGYVEAFSGGDETLAAFLNAMPSDERAIFEAALKATDAAGGGRTFEAFQGFMPKRNKLKSNFALRGSDAVGTQVEFTSRFMLSYDTIVQGMKAGARNGQTFTPDELFTQAAARTKKFLIDYTDRGVADEALTNIIPFWMWMSRNLPLQLINQWTNPKAYAIYGSLMRNLGLDDEDEVVPSWLKEQGAVKIATDWYLSPDLGFNRLNQQVKEMADPTRLLSYMNPALRVPLELTGNRRLYNNVPFSDKPQDIAGGPMSALVEALLRLAGQTKTAADGTSMTSDKANYALLNMLPFLSQAERLVPATDPYKARQAGSWLSYFGVPVRQVTPQMRESELKRRQRAIEQFARQLEQLGYTA